MIKIVFFGTSSFAVPTLQKLLDLHFDIVAVVTQPDKPQGRTKQCVPSPIKQLAQKYNLPVIQPEKLNLSDLKNYPADLGVLVAYGQLINPDIIKSYQYGIINIHPSLLPQYRGPSPVQSALLDASPETGTSIMVLDNNLDTGPIINQKKIFIASADDYLSLSNKLAILSADLLATSIDKYINKEITPVSQNNDHATYSKIINKKNGEIKLTDHPEQIISKLKAFTPWPGIYFIWKNKRFKILSAHLNNNKLVIDTIQPEGKKSMIFAEFIKGYRDFNF